MKKERKITYTETKNNLKMSWKFVKKEKKTLILLIIFSIILSAVGVITPILSAKILLNITNGLFNELIKVTIFMFLIETTRNIVRTLSSYIQRKYSLKMVTNIQLEMIKEIIKIETKELDKTATGTFIDRMGDVNSIITIFNDLSLSFVDFISNFGILIASLYINKYMFIYFIISSLIISFINKKRRDIYTEESKKYLKKNERKTSLSTEIIRGIRDIKLLNSSKSIEDKTKRELNIINKTKLDMEKTYNKYDIISSETRDILDITFILLGIFLVKNNTLTLANFLVLYMYRGRIESLLSYYDRFATLIKNYNISATRVFEVLEDYFKKEPNTGIDLDLLQKSIEFQNVTFSYQQEEVLKNISFKINKGEKVGFVGASGSGKTTIFSLLVRLYKLDKGNILLDETNINDINISSLRKNISLIPQSPYIFNFTVLENLLLANPNATEKDIEDACKKADIYDKIMELEDKFNTKLGEGGIILSGGEKQRLSIARTLLKNSNIILFDEATSSLDNISQEKIKSAIYKIDNTKTVLIIAHRLSTVIDCDKIIVLSEGKIIDIGTHKELLTRCKKYQELYKYEERNTK